MVDENKCLICESNETSVINTRISDFLVERVFEGQNKSINLIHCKKCGFAYYDFRPDESQMNKFYSGYRNEEYQKQRQKYDCWYTKEINAAMGQDKKELENRNRNATRIFTKNIDVKKIKTILDFGGDKGQYIPEIFTDAEKFVYEISGVKPVEDVTSISDINDLNTRKFDLIMCNHVLEHVADPNQTILNLKEISEKDSYLYLELPFDSPFYKNPLSNLAFLFNKYYSWKVIFKYFITLLKRGVFAPMTEHISFFTPESVAIFLEKNGYKVIQSEIVNVDCGWNKARFICVLAKK